MARARSSPTLRTLNALSIAYGALSVLLLLGLPHAVRAQRTTAPTAVEVVATATAYVPSTLTFSHPGRAFTSCLGNTAYLVQFMMYGDSGSVSGTAQTDTHCTSTWQPPSTSAITVYRQYNYVVVKGDAALYLLACNPRTAAQGLFSGLSNIADAAAGGQTSSSSRIEPDYRAQKCVASFGMGAKYLLTIDKTHVLLASDAKSHPVKMDYVSSVALAVLSVPNSPAAAKSNSKLIYFGFSNRSESPDDTIRMAKDWGLQCPNWKATINKQDSDYQVLFGDDEQFTMIGKRGEVLYSGSVGPLYMPKGSPDGSGVNLCKMTQ